MKPEQERPHSLRSSEVFGLSESEKRYYKLSDTRFQSLLKDEASRVHRVSLEVNSFGEYLFVTLSRELDGQRYFITCYGLGFHEQREQWVIEEWCWYEQRLDNRYAQQSLSKPEAEAIIQQRKELVWADKLETAPSERAILFSLLADLTDEDGALAELDDLESGGLLWEDEEDNNNPF